MNPSQYKTTVAHSRYRFRTASVLTAVAALMSLFSISGAFGQYAPPSGGEDLFDFLSPLSVGLGSSVTCSESPAADALNPAASALKQRVTLDAGYAALAGLGENVSGVRGHIVNLGGVLPTRAGVLASTLHFLTSGYNEVQLGNTFGWNLSFSKALYPTLLVGIGANLYVGNGNGDSLTTGLTTDIGLVHAPGRSYGVRNLRVGIVLQEIGKWYQPFTDRSGYPSPFTPRLGFAFDPIETEEISMSVFADATLPTFRNLRLSAGGIVTFQRVLSLYGGVRLDLRQLLDSDIPNRSLIPSFGISINIDTDFDNETSFIGRQGWNRSEVRTRASAAPLYSGVWALSSGINAPLGVLDDRPPRISVDYRGLISISPNNDGIQDDVSLDLSITDERFLRGYSVHVENANGEIVTSIENKEDRPETEGFQNVMDRLLAVETGISVPEEIRWDGTSASGGRVPDGEYELYVEAWDDTGNLATAGPFAVSVDATPPSITIQPVPQDLRVFSPNGDGQKDTITILQEGSREEQWTASIESADGHVVLEERWLDQAPTDFVWTGRNDAGELVADGVYRYRVSSVDAAGNRVAASLENIIVNNLATPITLTIDSSEFSPNGDGVADIMTFFADVPIVTGVEAWELLVEASTGEVVQRLGDTSTPPTKIAFTGRQSNGRVLAEGRYRGVLSVSYENGNQPEATSPFFSVDLTPPSAIVQTDTSVFSPNGDGNIDNVTFFQETSVEERWVGTIRATSGEIVRTFEWVRQADPRYIWAGQDAEGRSVPDGTYTYVLEATDSAGNRFESTPVTVQKDTSATGVLLTAELDVFSPNADGTRDRIQLFPSVDEGTAVAAYEITIKDASGRDRRQFSGQGELPDSIVWDGRDDSGRLVDDGVYRAQISAEFRNGNQEEGRSAPIVVDTEVPTVEARTRYTLFSPDGDGRRDTVRVTQSSSSEGLWEGRIEAADGTIVRSYFWKGTVESIIWDGTDEAGNLVEDGEYRYVVTSTDPAGNSARAAIDGLRVDSRPTTVFVTANRVEFSPNGDDVLDSVTIEAYVNLVDGAENWELAILSDRGTTVRRFSGEQVEPAITIEWDGYGSSGRVTDGEFSARFTVNYEKGNRPSGESSSFRVDTTAPLVNLNLSPLPFSPDNDGVEDELRIGIEVEDESSIRAWRFEILDRNDRFFQQFTGRSEPAGELIWDGRSSTGERVLSAEDYPYRFTISDSVGNISEVSGVIPVDILVVREGDRLKVRIADITFLPNSPRLVTDASTQQGAKNRAILLRLAEVFERYDTYRIRIEGHAVNVTGTEREEREELAPLSLSRAQEVKDALVDLGMNPRRISVLGRGGTEPIVPHTDTENRWKNRRVEFILLR